MKNKTGLILLIIAAAAVVLTMTFNRAKQSDYENWMLTDGVVTAIGEVRKFRVRVYYDYTVDGEMLSSWESLPIRYNTIPAVGERVSVWFDSEDAGRTSLSKPEISLLDSIAPIFPVTVLLLAVIFASRRNKTEYS